MIDYHYRVKLRRIEQADLAQMLKWRNDYRVFRWCRQNDLISWESHLKWYGKICKDKSISMYAIVWVDDKDPQTENFVGVCGLTDIDRTNRRAEFSLYIGPEFWGKDLGFDALSTLLKHAFDNLNLNCIWGETVGDNPAQELFVKLGMKKEGARQDFYYRDGKYHDAFLYSITAKQFRKDLT